ncbi:recombinase family protein [Bradyrhizobium sp. USDA 326]|uniref:recombinase family protein n=1 Tax=Bradyrhizobium sp. USDA 326 TaxID=3377726 RepID=UPI003C71EE2E
MRRSKRCHASSSNASARKSLRESNTADEEAVEGGNSPRDIAAALNKKGVPGPRGGAWNASTIDGSRKRLNGILQNELYAGRIIWNRQRPRGSVKIPRVWSLETPPPGDRLRIG